MQEYWNIPIDTKNPHQPIITIVILNFHPYTYALTLRAIVRGELRDIRRWDNVNKPDHMDIFHITKDPIKHQRTPFEKIRKTRDLKKIVLHIFENWDKYVTEFQR